MRVERGAESGGRRRGWHQRNAHLVGESGGVAALVDDLDRRRWPDSGGTLRGDQRGRQHVLKGDQRTARRRRRTRPASLLLISLTTSPQTLMGNWLSTRQTRVVVGQRIGLVIGGLRGRRPGEDDAVAFAHGGKIVHRHRQAQRRRLRRARRGTTGGQRPGHNSRRRAGWNSSSSERFSVTESGSPPHQIASHRRRRRGRKQEVAPIARAHRTTAVTAFALLLACCLRVAQGDAYTSRFASIEFGEGMPTEMDPQMETNPWEAQAARFELAAQKLNLDPESVEDSQPARARTHGTHSGSNG